MSILFSGFSRLCYGKRGISPLITVPVNCKPAKLWYDIKAMNEIAITKDLRAAGFSQEQSETLTRNIKTLSREAVNRDYVESLVRDVIRDGEVATREDIAKLDSKIDKLDTKVDFKVDKLDTKISIILNIMIPMMTAIFGVIVLMAFKTFL